MTGFWEILGKIDFGEAAERMFSWARCMVIFSGISDMAAKMIEIFMRYRGELVFFFLKKKNVVERISSAHFLH